MNKPLAVMQRVGLRGKFKDVMRRLYNNPCKKSLSPEHVIVVGWYKATQFSMFEDTLNRISDRSDMSYQRKWNYR